MILLSIVLSISDIAPPIHISNYGENPASAPSTRKCSYQERKTHVTNVCQRDYGTTGLTTTELTKQLTNRVSKHLLVDDKHKIIYCHCGKVGSTTYKSLFAQYSKAYLKQYGNVAYGKLFRTATIHKALPKFGLRWIARIEEEDRREALDSYTKVLTVRHPLARLYSFYKNKLESGGRSMKGEKCKPYQRFMGPKITKAMRPQARMNNLTCATDVSFAEFASYYAENPEIQRDRHLIPISAQCDPCSMDYDYILRLETGDSDQNFFLESLLREQTFEENDGAVHANAKSNHSESGWRNNNFIATMKQYKPINTDVLSKLTTIYERDFRIFGYSIKNKSTMGCKITLPNGTTCC